MTLSKQKIIAIEHLIAHAFIKIRATCHDESLSETEKLARIEVMAQAFHNVPWIISQTDVDEEKLLSDIAVIGGSFYQRAKEIIESP